MNNKIVRTFRKHPFVKLKIASGKRFIDFKTNGQFSIIDQNGIVIEKNISTDLKWRLKVEYFKNERNSYSFMICLYRNKNFALNILNKLKKQNYDVRLQRIGGIIKIGNKKIESTFYRVLIGEYNCIKDALNSNCYKMLEFNPSIICEKVSKPKAVFELCDENINRVFKIKNSIQIITNNSHTNTLIYNVLNDEDKIEKEVLKVFGDIEFNIGKNKTINILKKISLEKYLKNIIYHELGSDFHLEILKSQAVLSRGTILLNMSKLNDEDYDFSDKSYPTFINSSKDVLNKIEQAVMKTKGEVLIYNNNLCRTPYCKSCGGYLNNNYFFYRDTLNKYLKRGLDTNKVTGKKSLSLRSESKIEKWINDKPDVLCNPKNFNSENPFIKENNFFRWNISFSRSELEEIIRSNGYGYDI